MLADAPRTVSAAFGRFVSFLYSNSGSQVARRTAELTMYCRCWATTINRTIDPNHNGGAPRLETPSSSCSYDPITTDSYIGFGTYNEEDTEQRKEKKENTILILKNEIIVGFSAYASKLGKSMLRENI